MRNATTSGTQGEDRKIDSADEPLGSSCSPAAGSIGGTVASSTPSEDADDGGHANPPDTPSEQPEDAPTPTP